MADCPKCGREYRNSHEVSDDETVYVHGVREVDAGEETIDAVHDKCVVSDDAE